MGKLLRQGARPEGEDLQRYLIGDIRDGLSEQGAPTTYGSRGRLGGEVLAEHEAGPWAFVS